METFSGASFGIAASWTPPWLKLNKGNKITRRTGSIFCFIATLVYLVLKIKIKNYFAFFQLLCRHYFFLLSVCKGRLGFWVCKQASPQTFRRWMLPAHMNSVRTGILASCYLLLASCYLLLATCHLLLATCYLILNYNRCCNLTTISAFQVAKSPAMICSLAWLTSQR